MMQTGPAPRPGALTEEQKARIERNRQEALAKRARLQQQQPAPALLGQPAPPPQYRPTPPPARARQASDVGVVMVDANEAAIIEQALMAAEKRPLPVAPSTGSGTAHVLPTPGHASPWQQRQPAAANAAQHEQPAQLRTPMQPPPATAGPAVTVALAVTEHGMFKAQVPFHAGVVGVFKTIKTRSYDSTTRVWSFSIGDHDELVKRLSGLGGVTVKALPSNVIKALAAQGQAGAMSAGSASLPSGGGVPDSDAAADASAEDKLQTLPPDLLASLMPFQREGVKFAVRHSGRVLIGDEMGLGKTLQGIAIAKLYESDWPCLVVVPSALRLVWKNELLRWLPDLGEDDLSVVMKGSDRLRGRVTVISYDLLTRNAKSFGDGKRQGSSQDCCKFGVVIVDESHYLKNPEALRTRVVDPIVRNAKVAVMLSGTPALSRPIELYKQVAALRPKLLPSLTQYAARYCDAKPNKWGGTDRSGASNIDELRALLKCVMIRRRKAEVLTQLPAKRRQTVFLELPASQTRDLRKKLEQCQKLKNIDDNPCYPEAERARAANESRQIFNEIYVDSGLAKLPQVCDYINMLAEGGCKFLVFAHHKQVIDGICKSLREAKFQHIRIDGSTAMGEREQLVRTFQNDARMQVAVLSITAAGVGLTLTAANAVVFAELTWVPGNIIQAEDRAHRIGQQYSVNIHFLLAKDTVDDVVWPCIEKKLHVVGNCLDGEGLARFGGEESSAVAGAGGDSTQPSIRAFLSQSPGAGVSGGGGVHQTRFDMPLGPNSREAGDEGANPKARPREAATAAPAHPAGTGVGRDGATSPSMRQRWGGGSEPAGSSCMANDAAGACGGSGGCGTQSADILKKGQGCGKRKRVFQGDSDDD